MQLTLNLGIETQDKVLCSFCCNPAKYAVKENFGGNNVILNFCCETCEDNYFYVNQLDNIRRSGW